MTGSRYTSVTNSQSLNASISPAIHSSRVLPEIMEEGPNRPLYRCHRIVFCLRVLDLSYLARPGSYICIVVSLVCRLECKDNSVTSGGIMSQASQIDLQKFLFPTSNRTFTQFSQSQPKLITNFRSRLLNPVPRPGGPESISKGNFGLIFIVLQQGPNHNLHSQMVVEV